MLAMWAHDPPAFLLANLGQLEETNQDPNQEPLPLSHVSHAVAACGDEQSVEPQSVEP